MSRKNPWANPVDRASIMRGIMIAAKKRREKNRQRNGDMHRPKRGKRMSLAWYRSTLEELFRAYTEEFGCYDPIILRNDRPSPDGPFLQMWQRVRPQWLASYPFEPKTDPKENAKFQRCDGEIALHGIDWALLDAHATPSDFHEAVCDIPDWLAGKHLNQTGTDG